MALVGNPNCGKTTLFNRLTGSDQQVGNWSGVTVEKKVGYTADGRYRIVDLPGIYSMSAGSPEEKICRDYLLGEEPDVILNIVDGTNLERNLLLTLQLEETGIPMVLAVNMADELEKSGCRLDVGRLSQLLGVSAAAICARNGRNLSMLKRLLDRCAENGKSPALPELPFEMEEVVGRIKEQLPPGEKGGFYAARMFEKDTSYIERLELSREKQHDIWRLIEEYEKAAPSGDSRTEAAGARFRLIKNILAQAVSCKAEKASSLTDKADKLALGRYTAFPVFFLVMMAIFSLTFGKPADILSELISKVVSEGVIPFAETLLLRADAPIWARSLIVDGAIGGVGGVLSFLPQIAILFFCLTFLEDSGYMARAAFIADKPLSRLGLSGKSFIPMLMGLGCTTPAVMASRTQENRSERLLTILLIPFMSCGARLPIYALFAAAFFKRQQGLVIFSMYLIGFAAAWLVGIILSRTVFSGSGGAFIMEMPPYRLPKMSYVLKSSFNKIKDFIVRAGTVIFAMSVAIWAMQSFTPELRFTDSVSESIFAAVGELLAPLLKPLGFGFREAAVALLAGFVAKEAVVSTLLVSFGAANEGVLAGALSGMFQPLSAFSFMVFCLLYVPCVSAFATIKKETGSLRWALLSCGIQLTAAYLVSLGIYQVGRIFV